MLKEISIVIPAYNEEKRIFRSLNKIIGFCEKRRLKYEIIVVDDGSSDKTKETVNSVANENLVILKNETRQGKGAAVKKGVLAARYSNILFTDADLSTPIWELDKFIPYLNKFDIIIGSRAIMGSQIKVHQPRYKELLGRLGNKLVKLILVKGIDDTQCGFKIFKDKCKAIFEKQKILGWAFDFEILFLAQKKGYKIKEMPVTWINDARSKVKNIDYLRTFWDLLKIKLNYIIGKY